MNIILSQRIDIESDYDDLPFSTYHYPKKYRNQIHSSDRFIYYQGDRLKKSHRYYYGCGVIGLISHDVTGDGFYAKILDGRRFPVKVPIYHPDGVGFIENLDFQQVREKPTPSWQNSIRKVSDQAFDEILILGNILLDFGISTSLIEKESNPIDVLFDFNNRFVDMSPKERSKNVQKYLDRGVAVTKALKSLLGAVCQICGWCGFSQSNGQRFIEAHHIVQLS